MPDRIDYDHHQHAVYARGRALPEAAMNTWTRVFAAHAPARRPLTVADLGSGTGRFTPRLAAAFGGPVYGVEPSARMRAVAEQSASHPAVTYLDGRAEQIPLPAASCDLVLMYLVLHHIQDRSAAAREIARVLRRGGRLLIQSDFPGTSPPRRYWHRYFPAARTIEAALFPTLREVTATFGAAGFRQVSLNHIDIELAPSLGDYLARLRLRAISTFERMTDQQITAGFAALQADAAAETQPSPAVETATLLVLAI